MRATEEMLYTVFSVYSLGIIHILYKKMAKAKYDFLD